MEDVGSCEVVHINSMDSDFCGHYRWTEVFAVGESYMLQLPTMAVWWCGEFVAARIVCVGVCLELECFNISVSVAMAKFPMSMHDDTSLLAAEM